MDDVVQIVTTVEKKEDAVRLAEHLLRARLAACVQIVGPLESRYWWQGSLESATEYQCVIKSRKVFADKVKERIMEEHPYQVPEILVLPVLDVAEAYGRWLQEELGHGPGQDLDP